MPDRTLEQIAKETEGRTPDSHEAQLIKDIIEEEKQQPDQKPPSGLLEYTTDELEAEINYRRKYNVGKK